MPRIKPVKKYKGYLFKRGSIYWLQYSYRDASGNIVRLAESLKTTSKPEAEKKAAEITEPLLLKADVKNFKKVLQERMSSALEKIQTLEAARNRIPLSSAWQKFPYDVSVRGNVKRPLKPKVILKHTQLWAAFVKWMAANRPESKFLDEVTEADTQAYSDHCRKQLKCGPRGHNDRIKICRVVCGLAGQKPNPFAAVKKWSERNSESRDCLEMSELKKIMEIATGEMRLLVMFGLFTGLRLGDAATLTWKDILDGRVYKVTGKTNRPVSLAIAPPLQAELAALLPRPKKQDYIMPGLAGIYLKEPQALCKRIRQLFEEAGIEVVEQVAGRKRGVSRRGFHALRTSFVSICARNGVPTELISQWAGHSPQINAIYQRFGNKERDERILGALGQIATVALPTPTLDIEIKSREIGFREQLLTIAQSMTNDDAEKALALLKANGFDIG